MITLRLEFDVFQFGQCDRFPEEGEVARPRRWERGGIVCGGRAIHGGPLYRKTADVSRTFFKSLKLGYVQAEYLQVLENNL